MRETKFGLEMPKESKKGSPTKGGFDKLRRYVTQEELKERAEKNKNDDWREQE